MDPTTKDKIDYIFAEFKNGLTLDGRAKVFELGKKLKSGFLIDRSKPEPYTKPSLESKTNTILQFIEANSCASYSITKKERPSRDLNPSRSLDRAP